MLPSYDDDLVMAEATEPRIGAAPCGHPDQNCVRFVETAVKAKRLPRTLPVMKGETAMKVPVGSRSAGTGSGSGGRSVSPGPSGSIPAGYRRGFRNLPRSIGVVTFVEHVVEFFLIAGLVVALGLVTTFLVARSYVRRHWRLLHGHVAVRGILAIVALVAAGRERYAGRATPEDLSRGAAARVRRRMRVAVEDAEIAVAHAESRDAPVAELPAVCRSLQRVADELDGLLKLERRLPPGANRADVRRQVAEVIGAARDVQAAAVRAGSDATEPQVRSLVRHASDEVDIVSTALAAMRSVARPH